MFEELSRKLDSVFKKIKGQGKLSEDNIKEALRDVRRVLLEADVNFRVAKKFIQAVQEKAVGREVVRSITPGQQVVKIVYDELSRLMGQSAADLHFSNIPPTIFMIVGLQGSGKTTFVGKLAKHLRSKGHTPLMVAVDIYRPAAVKQLQTIGKQLDISVFFEENTNPVDLSKKAISFSRHNGQDCVILDTAGRLHIDRAMMDELVEIKKTVSPNEILFVADGMTGQDAVKAAEEFMQQLDFNGVVLTKMDGDARGGAALSIKAVTGKPIMFFGTGEKFDALEIFHPDRMASRILGMGDIVSLVEKAQATIDREQAEKIEKKIRRQEFTLEDFLDQMHQIKKMGPLDQIIGMIPGLGNSPLGNIQVDEGEMVKIEAIINSMTRDERRRSNIMNGSRRKRVARGSGTSVQDVNRLLNQFSQMQKMMKRFSKMGKRGFGKNLFPF
ncbi:MAG TPA: signal recognition particle protein [Bacteroidetes bacterium]|nr:signal recognition particle protein [Bacteroidota bacterium]